MFCFIFDFKTQSLVYCVFTWENICYLNCFSWCYVLSQSWCQISTLYVVELFEENLWLCIYMHILQLNEFKYFIWMCHFGLAILGTCVLVASICFYFTSSVQSKLQFHKCICYFVLSFLYWSPTTRQMHSCKTFFCL